MKEDNIILGELILLRQANHTLGKPRCLWSTELCDKHIKEILQALIKNSQLGEVPPQFPEPLANPLNYDTLIVLYRSREPRSVNSLSTQSQRCSFPLWFPSKTHPVLTRHTDQPLAFPACPRRKDKLTLSDLHSKKTHNWFTNPWWYLTGQMNHLLNKLQKALRSSSLGSHKGQRNARQ